MSSEYSLQRCSSLVIYCIMEEGYHTLYTSTATATTSNLTMTLWNNTNSVTYERKWGCPVITGPSWFCFRSSPLDGISTYLIIVIVIKGGEATRAARFQRGSRSPWRWRVFFEIRLDDASLSHPPLNCYMYEYITASKYTVRVPSGVTLRPPTGFRVIICCCRTPLW